MLDYKNTISTYTPIIVTPHLPQPGRARVGISGEFLDNFPNHGDDFILQIPYILYRDSKNNENSCRDKCPNPGGKLRWQIITNPHPLPDLG